jgi:hypothetical protein
MKSVLIYSEYTLHVVVIYGHHRASKILKCINVRYETVCYNRSIADSLVY